MKNIRVSISLGTDEKVSGIITLPDGHTPGRGTGIIIAHGAGNDMENPLLEAFAEGLAKAGFTALRFNFPYKEKGRKSPDSPKKLVHTWQSALKFFKEHKTFSPETIVAAGKSMGGRIASQMAADGLLDVGRLIFLGYPLHPPGKKEKLRDTHLYKIRQPMLFFAGTRDALCDLPSLENVLQRLTGTWDLKTIEGGDHSFSVPNSSGVTTAQVYDQIIRKTCEWLDQ